MAITQAVRPSKCDVLQAGVTRAQVMDNSCKKLIAPATAAEKGSAGSVDN